MMILTDLLSMILRLAELVFATIVAGITGHYLHDSHNQSPWKLGQFIYTEVVAGLSIFLSIVWLFPFAGSFIHWPADFFLSVAWFTVFGLLVNWLYANCGGHTFAWTTSLDHRGTNANCVSWRTTQAFAFICAICWLVSALLGMRWVRKHTQRNAATTTTTTTRSNKRWYRRSRV